MFGLHESQKDRHGFGLEDCHKVRHNTGFYESAKCKGLVCKSKKRQN